MPSPPTDRHLEVASTDVDAPPAGGNPAKAIRGAWCEVVDGYGKALEVPGLPEHERARLIRCYRLAAEKAGVRPVAVATPVEGEE